MTLIQLSGVGIDYGATTILRDVTFTIAAGERWGVVGRNGSGKTSLLRVITGHQQPTRGTVARQPGLRVVVLEQYRDFGDATTVWEAAAGPFAELLALEQSLALQAKQLEHDHSERAMNRYARDLERFEREGGYTFAPAVDAVLQGLGFDPVEARERPIAQLSGGERGRVGLARQLVAPAELLLLDEPTNHLDLDTSAWLESWLRETSKAVVVVSHDRAFLAAIADHVLHVELQTAVAYTGGYEAFVRQRAERRLSAQRAYDKQQRVVAAEEDYIRRNIAGQNTRQAKGRRKRLSRLPRLSAPGEDSGAMSLRLESAERGGDQVLVARDVRIAIGEGEERRVLLDGFTATIARGEVVGLIGPNGAGKSTLLRTLLGERSVDAGELRLGGSIRPAYYRQDLAQVPMDRTLYEVIADLKPQWERGTIQGHLGRFDFSGDEVLRRADSLSGGERARVALAMMMLTRANFLALDEPTNHLDVESIEALEDAVSDFDGSVLLVSHDRELLRALVTRVWVLRDGHITDYPGTFVEWEEASVERAHAAAVRASEAEALRRVKERQKTAPASQPRNAARDRDRAEREARKALTDLEAKIATLETKVATISAALDDPELYTKPNGVAEAKRLGAALDAARVELDGALEQWAAAEERIVELAARDRSTESTARA